MFTPISILPSENSKTEVSIETTNNSYVLRINVTQYATEKKYYAGTTAFTLIYNEENKEAFVKMLEQLEQAIHVARQENEI